MVDKKYYTSYEMKTHYSSLATLMHSYFDKEITDPCDSDIAERAKRLIDVYETMEDLFSRITMTVPSGDSHTYQI